MHSLPSKHRLPLMLAALLTLALLTSSVLGAHAHADGVPHYNDCDICLQLTGLDSSNQQTAPLARLNLATTSFVITGYHVEVVVPRLFKARAPPLTLTQH